MIVQEAGLLNVGGGPIAQGTFKPGNTNVNALPAIAAANGRARLIVLKAGASNSATVAVGGSSTNQLSSAMTSGFATNNTTDGWPLAAGETYPIPIVNAKLDEISVKFNNANDVLHYQVWG
jgi:hypothetical protein